MQALVHLTMKSRNGKVGLIPVSTTGRDSCGDCPLKRNGCYAEYGPLRWHWDKVTRGELGVDWHTFCDAIAGLPEESLWRHNQAGDLPHNAGRIDAPMLVALVNANSGRRGFTYTHHDIRLGANLSWLRYANDNGFTVNLSADNLSEADDMADTGLPTVTVLSEHQVTNTVTPKGRRVVVCPAVTHDNVSCKSCQLCQRADRAAIVGFPAHGGGKDKATKVFMLREA